MKEYSTTRSMAFTLFQRKKSTVWHLLDCSASTPRTRSVKAGDVVPLGGDALWRLKVEEERAILERENATGSLTYNGRVSLAPEVSIFANGAGEEPENTLVIPSVQGNLTLLVKRGAAPAWATGGKGVSLNVSTALDGHQGPFPNLAALRRSLVPGRVEAEDLLWVEGSEAAFYVLDVWPDLASLKIIKPPKKGGDNVTEVDEDPLITGDLKCLYCPHSFNRGDALYVHKTAGKPPFHPGHLGKYNKDMLPLDEEGSIYTDKDPRACPHCGQRLPDSFFDPHPRYTVISLVGQSMAGKSYYLATLFRQLPDYLAAGGFGCNGDDASLNTYMDALSNIPFNPGEPIERFIEKTGQATQIRIALRKKTYHVPRPFISKVTSVQDVALRTVFYDNPGEHFTSVHEGELTTQEARIAASHLAHAQAIFVLYDPTADAVIRGKLGLKADHNKTDAQRAMLTNLPKCIDSQWDVEENGPRARNLPVACLVAKWDSWGKELAPDLHGPEEYEKNGWLDFNVVEENSQRVEKMLRDNRCGVSAALAAISSTVKYFPVSALGMPPIEVRHPSGINVWAPRLPAEPWAVWAPVLWALGRIRPQIFPTDIVSPPISSSPAS